MLTDTPRECTILTKEPCEFLSISEKVGIMNCVFTDYDVARNPHVLHNLVD